MVGADKLTAWLSRLVQIPSVTPVQAGPRAGEPGEARIAAKVAECFAKFGGEVHTEEGHPNRPNIYGLWRGKTDRWAALDVHTDTVGVEQMVGDPFSGRIADDRVYGRGAVDTKASLGVALALLEWMHEHNITPEVNLLIAATADEEDGAQNAPVFANWVMKQDIPLNELMVAEPTLCQPVYGHKGRLRVDFEIEGVSSHSSKPHLGKNAIAAAAHLVVALEAEHKCLQSIPPATELGAATLTVSLIEGGTGSNVVPDYCTIGADYRLVPGETAQGVTAQLNNLAQQHCPLPVTMNFISSIEPFFNPADTDWIKTLSVWSQTEPMVVPYGTNAWAYEDLSGECLVFGPGSIDQAHGDVEWVAISELEKLAGIYKLWWGIG